MQFLYVVFFVFILISPIKLKLYKIPKYSRLVDNNEENYVHNFENIPTNNINNFYRKEFENDKVINSQVKKTNFESDNKGSLENINYNNNGLTKQEDVKYQNNENAHSNSKSRDESEDYEDALLEHTPDGGFKVIPLSDLNSLNGKEINEQINNLKSITRQKLKRDSKLEGNVKSVFRRNCKNENSKTNLFKKIIEELEDIRSERSKCGGKEGLPCAINGSWISFVGCSRLNIELIENHEIQVTFSKPSSPPRKGLFNENWIGKGEVPFSTGGLFSITAWNSKTKQMATFIGQCRFCAFAETISGWWSFGRPARDCRDLLSCGNIRADIIRREIIHNLRANKMHQKMKKQKKYGEKVLPKKCKKIKS